MQERLENMRVIGGIYRHRKLYWPSDSSIRPTKDRIREAIFSSLGPLDNMSFLDLFSGSGAMGIEAISRGSNDVVFVDINLNAIKCIKENLKSLDISKGYKVIISDYEDALNDFKEEKRKFDVIFLDPPYKEGRYEEIISFVLDNNLLLDNGIIVAESDKPLNVDESLFSKVKIHKYGEILVAFLRR